MTRLFEAKPFIIAEVGSNWKTLDDCLYSIAKARDCGADAVKFQLFDRQALYGHNNPLVELRGSLPQSWLPKLKACADACGIEFMCTAFSPELVAAVDPFVSVHKVASSDAAWPQMLEAIERTGKPALFSTGAKTLGEISDVEKFFADSGKYVSMYCVAAYPTDFVDLEIMEQFEGFSDHTLGYTAAVEAARSGMIAIEKHFTAITAETPDAPHSLKPEQFKRMVDIIRGRPVESEEKAMFLRHNRRLIAMCDVEAGATLNYGKNFGAYRSLVDAPNCMSPFDWEEVEGKRARGAIKRGQSITEADLA